MEGQKSQGRSILATALGFAAAMGGDLLKLSPAQQFHRQRGKAPPGKRWADQSAYTPAGRFKNTKGNSTVPARIAAQMNAMHEKWLAQRNTRQSCPV